MIGIGTALRSELYLARRSWLTFVVLILPSLAALMRILLGRLQTLDTGARQAISGLETGVLQSAGSGAESAFGPLVDGLRSGFTLGHLVMVAVAAQGLSSDLASGALRHLLIQSSSRAAWLAARFLSLCGLCLLSVVAFTSVSALCTALLYDFGPVVEEGYELVSVREFLDQVSRGFVLALIALPAAVGLGLLLAALSRSSAVAVGAALGGTLAFDLFKPYLGDAALHAHPAMLPSLADTSYLAQASLLVRGYSDVVVEEGAIVWNLWPPVLEACALLFLTLVLFRRRPV